MKTFGWGFLYDVSTDGKYSSCMTNHEGPTESRFEHCDMTQVIYRFLKKEVKICLKYRNSFRISVSKIIKCWQSELLGIRF